MSNVVYVGHSTVLVDLDGVRLLTDPLLRERVTFLRRASTVDVDQLRNLDAVLISHAHYDHLDIRSLELLGRSVPVVVPRGLGRLLEGHKSVIEVVEDERDLLRRGDRARDPRGARGPPAPGTDNGSPPRFRDQRLTADLLRRGHGPLPGHGGSWSPTSTSH